MYVFMITKRKEVRNRTWTSVHVVAREVLGENYTYRLITTYCNDGFEEDSIK